MAASKVYVSTQPGQEGIVDDPCGPEGQALCEPQCLVQPRFFCGQLLTDQDLTALLDWAKGKFQLDRHIHGWGVSCGLQVRCDPEQAGGVIIEPGYAVDSCGNDIVLCEPAPLNLSDACRIPENPCVDLTHSARETPEPQARSMAGLKARAGSITAVDIFVRYHSTDIMPLPALGRGACAEREACEFSRTQEGHEVYWKAVNAEAYPLHESLAEWERGYFLSSRQVVDRFIDRFGNGGYGEHLEEIQTWLLEWVRQHPLYQFCFLHDAVCELSAQAKNLDQQLAYLLFWMVLDGRIAYLSSGCVPGTPGQGVPLARVHLQRQGDEPGDCHVYFIDGMPPHRRPLELDRWPAPLGQFNLGQLVWHRMEEVCETLKDAGIVVQERNLTVARTPRMLQELLNAEWEIPDYKEAYGANCGLFSPVPCEQETPLIAYVLPLDASTLGTRAVMFCRRPLEMEEPAGAERPASEKPQGERPSNRPTDKEAQETQEEYISPLTEIDGIAQERARTLHAHGITTFEQLEKTSTDDLKELFPRVSRKELDKWRKVAKDLKG